MDGSLWWIRRDLRLGDNPALAAALAGGPVMPVFVLDPDVLASRYHRNAGRRQAFLFDGLRVLDADLRRAGSRLIVRTGRPEQELPRLARETGATRIVAAEDYSPLARRRDEAVSKAIDLQFMPGIAVHSPRDIFKSDGAPFRVFTPYSRAWLALPLPDRHDLIPAPVQLPPVSADVTSVPISSASGGYGAFEPGETAARKRLDRFASGIDAPIDSYAEGRNRLDLDGTSALSPYLRFGMISARQVAVAANERRAAGFAGRGAAVWLNELIWRDFYLSVLYHVPEVMQREFDPLFRGIEWRNDASDIAAWKAGVTGYPVVDAAMRQLAATGWIHNRARMIVASFLVKHLLVDWRIGEQWFMDQLVDGDPAANNGGWQWTAGVGTDAAPYFRVFNPVLQARKFDPEGVFVRRWLPELATLPTRYVHEPWRVPATVQRAAGVVIGHHYPAPIVDLAEGRRRALEAYRRAKERNAQ